jgi:hypothetical protein
MLPLIRVQALARPWSLRAGSPTAAGAAISAAGLDPQSGGEMLDVSDFARIAVRVTRRSSRAEVASCEFGKSSAFSATNGLQPRESQPQSCHSKGAHHVKAHTSVAQGRPDCGLHNRSCVAAHGRPGGDHRHRCRPAQKDGPRALAPHLAERPPPATTHTTQTSAFAN